MTNFLIKHFIPNASDVKSPAVRQRYGVVSGVVGILCNALLCTAKIAAGASDRRGFYCCRRHQ